MPKRCSVKTRWILVVALAVLATVPAWVTDVYYIRLLSGLFMYIALTQSWNLIGGYAGYLNLGHVTFVGLGGYVSAKLLVDRGISPFVSAPLAGLAAALLAIVVGYPSLRLRGPYFAVTTLAIAFVARLLFLNINAFGGGLGIEMPPPPLSVRASEDVFFWIFLAVAIGVCAAAFRVERSRFGLGLLAIRNDEDAAGTFGVNAVRLKLIAFIASAFVAGVVGALYGFQLGYIEPNIAFDIQLSILIVLMAMLGGAGRWAGPILGAAVVYLLTQTLVFVIPSELAQVVFGLILIGVIFAMPRGLAGLSDATWFRRAAGPFQRRGNNHQLAPVGASQHDDELSQTT